MVELQAVYENGDFQFETPPDPSRLKDARVKVVIAMPNVSESRILEINQLLGKTGLKFCRMTSPVSLLADNRPRDPSFTPAYAANASTIQP